MKVAFNPIFKYYPRKFSSRSLQQNFGTAAFKGEYLNAGKEPKVKGNTGLINSTFSDFIQPDIEKSVVATKPTKDEVIIAKTKKAVSECKYIVLALGILYFAMKKNLKINRIKKEAQKAADLAKMKIPKPELIKINPERVLNL